MSDLCMPAATRGALQLLEALHAIHSCNILHRDLKPSNLLLTADNELRLADFGVSKHLPNLTVVVKTEGVGTPGMQALEVLIGDQQSPGGDMWAVGILYWELLLGYHPCPEVGALREGTLLPHTGRRHMAAWHMQPQLTAAVLPSQSSQYCHSPQYVACVPHACIVARRHHVAVFAWAGMGAQCINCSRAVRSTLGCGRMPPHVCG
jgi:serine/threonine protein kinase